MCTSCHDTTSHTPDQLAEIRRRGDEELARMGVSRRGILLAGAALAAAGGLAATSSGPARAAAPAGNTKPTPVPELTWLVGDHHVHTQYSHDAKYKISQQLDAAEEWGVDWLVFTEHSNTGHHRQGVYDSLEEIRAEREARDLLIFQGIEWYIPAAEHCTVFVAPGEGEPETLRSFELVYDGKLNGWEKAAPGSPEAEEWEARAAEAIAWLGGQKADGAVADALVIANHPMRKGIDSPHEMRLWRDADPDIMIGMEGAPGAQGYGVGLNVWEGDQRGEYVNAPNWESHPAYTQDMLRPFGGFDWMTATVGGLWDSMLAEGLPFFITSNSDNHLTVKDTWKFDASRYPQVEPWLSATSEFDKFNVAGRRPDPVATNEPQGGSDFWPGQFSRTHVGATERSYLAVMEGLRLGRSWVDHGHLLAGFDVRVSALQPGKGNGRGNGNGRGWGNASGIPVTLGGRLQAKRGQAVEVSITVTTTDYENFAGIRPDLHHVDIIGGPITGAVSDRDTMRAPRTKVLRQFDTQGRRGTFTLTHRFEDVQESFYIRFRGSDGNRNGAGYHGASVDPTGPLRHGDAIGDADPWIDTWFYANPVFIDVV